MLGQRIDPTSIELRGITKIFGRVTANSDIHLKVDPGTIHAVIGENGAGKSTAMKILYGIYSPDAGEIFLNGKLKIWNSPLDAIREGVGMVHQHFMLAGPFTALDNIILGAEPPVAFFKKAPRFFRPIDRKRALQTLKNLGEQYGLQVPWEVPVEELPLGIQQRIEILKLLYRNAKVLILDEPTAVLTPSETQALFNNLKRLREEGKTIILITHKLREVMANTDKVTVFRGGRVTGEVKTKETNSQELANLMVGRPVDLSLAAPSQSEMKEDVLRIKKLSLIQRGRKKRLSNISFSVRSGEIVGIAGVDGNGQSELIRAILHPSEKKFRSEGEIWVFGKNVSEQPTQFIRSLGVGVIPEDRQKEGLLLETTLQDNFLIGFQKFKFYQRFGFLRFKNLFQTASQVIEEYDVRPRNLDTSVQNLSGGNQQKLIVGREFQNSPKLLLASQPTRGVDVGATEFIHRRIFRARNEGAGVLLVSSELDEIMRLSDRIYVLYEGEIVAEFMRGAANEKELGFHMSGAGKGKAK